MPIFTLQELKTASRGQNRYFSERYSYEDKEAYADRVLLNESRSFSKYRKYDIFLSHSIKDAIAILELKTILESNGLSVYVDWINDPLLDRSKVTKETAATLREKIQASSSLLLALSNSSKQSNWVQWELGYADGKKDGRVAILPIDDGSEQNSNFYRQEYLGLYPYIDKSDTLIRVNGDNPTNYAKLRDWLASSNPRSILYS